VRFSYAGLVIITVVAVVLLVAGKASWQRGGAQPGPNAPVAAQQDPWAGAPIVVPRRGLTDADAEVGLGNPLGRLPDVNPPSAEARRQAAEQERQEREDRRRQRAVYECILRNSRGSNVSQAALFEMCWDFPDLR
jgi:hypothetical protein